MTDEELQDFVASSRWVFAKTMPQWPHEYTLRRNARNESEFVRFAEEIRSRGEKRIFGSRTYVYLDIGGHEYWTMSDSVQDEILINRAIRK